MPRLVPRLLRSLKAPTAKPPVLNNRPRPKTRRTPAPPPPCPSLSPKGRKQSIILDSLRPIMAISKSRRHKEPYAPLRINTRLQKYTSHGDRDLPVRVMSEEERTLWASPYRALLAPFSSVTGTQYGRSQDAGKSGQILGRWESTYAIWYVCHRHMLGLSHVYASSPYPFLRQAGWR